MNDSPIQEQRSLIDRFKSRSIDSYRFTALKVAVFGLILMFVGQLVEWSELSVVGIWVMLAAFPIEGLYRIAYYARVVREADQIVDEAVRNAAEARNERGD